MNNTYGLIRQIIDLLDMYESEGELTNLLGFAEWMVIRLKSQPSLNKKIAKKDISLDQSEQLQYLRRLDDKTRFLEYISRISRLQDFYTRKFLSGLPLNNRLEYLFLYTVNRMGKARKTDLINIHLVEYTTGMDTIRRLVNSGMLEEKQDDSDKRARLLVITDYGKEIVNKAEKKIQDERNMFLACISSNKWKKTLPVLELINDFHSNIYINHNDKPDAELLNLMDSLKHLYK
ncbi:MAG: winged helix-turn-helix transcriptional regulator [Bacteroidales bacterium]|nr:winged helix-turn-helix transcriptional regulator [Bacteroidales bacterium]